MGKIARLFAFLIILFLMLFDLRSVMAISFPSSGIFGPFPSLKPFASKTPKPTAAPSSTSTPAPTATPKPAPVVFEIDDVEPSSANYMQEFTIYGGGFGTNTGSVNFRLSNQNFSSGEAPILSWSDSEIKAKVPAVKKGSYRIQVVTSDGRKTNEVRFSVKNGQPIINSSSIRNVNGKYELTFQGVEFGKRGSIDIYNGSTLVGKGVIRSWSTTRIRFELPALAHKQYGFQITSADGRQSSLRFFSVGN